MPALELDFDLQILKTGERYLANVVASPHGEASGEFTLPFSAVQLDDMFRGLGRLQAVTRGAAAPEIANAREFGTQLFDTVFAGDVRDCLSESRGTAAAEGANLRIRLRFNNVPELIDLPWELLYDRRQKRFLALDGRTTLIRHLPLPKPVFPLHVEPPLRVLVAISNPDRDLKTESEWTRLSGALAELKSKGLVELERVQPASHEALQARLAETRFHVLHFIGHGEYDAETGNGYLMLEAPAGGGKRIGGTRLGELLKTCESLKLVVLNTCEGGRTSRSDPFAGVAQSLVQYEIPAVVGMQFPMTDDAAIVFSTSFYATLAAGRPVDLALAEARRQVNLRGEEGDIEWATPVVYMRGDGRLFDVAARPATEPGLQAAAAPQPNAAARPKAPRVNAAPTPAPAPRMSAKKRVQIVSQAQAPSGTSRTAKHRDKAGRSRRPSRMMRICNVRPDALDPRDQVYQPSASVALPPNLFPQLQLPVLDQGETAASTGFALALVVNFLQTRSRREARPTVSPFMLYSMARRYDDFPGSRDSGASLRSALLGWQRHGACANALWTTGFAMPPRSFRPEDDWSLEAVRRPLGNYYRIRTDAISAIQAALNEIGIVYASAAVHNGWHEDSGRGAAGKRPTAFDRALFVIPKRAGAGGGHAFAIVGYDSRGFLIQNSWGAGWGSGGYAVLTYGDWQANAMDCWVAQLGVMTEDHEAISRSGTLRTDAQGRVLLATSALLRQREIAPFVISAGEDGRFSSHGEFRSGEDDVRALVDLHLPEARRRWKLQDKPLDVCLLAHGGLVGQREAADRAAEWISLLYERRVFPIFLLWRTDILADVIELINRSVRGFPPAAGVRNDPCVAQDHWFNARIERLLAPAGSALWVEVKQHSAALTARADAAAMKVWWYLSNHRQPLRLHLVGHSAGCLVHAYLIDQLAGMGTKFESVTFMAPALRLDVFNELVRPRLADGSIKRYQQFNLTGQAEEEDPSCAPYGRSLLALIEQSFEGGEQTPILGLQKYFDAYLPQLKSAQGYASPGPASTSTTHGGFDGNKATQRSVVEFIAGR